MRADRLIEILSQYPGSTHVAIKVNEMLLHDEICDIQVWGIRHLFLKEDGEKLETSKPLDYSASLAPVLVLKAIGKPQRTKP